MAAAGKRVAPLAIALVAFVALVARVRLIVATRGLPQFESPVLDSRYYLTTGTAWAEGTPPPARPFFMSPGYTAFVAVCARAATVVAKALPFAPTPAGVVVAIQVAADVLAAALVAALAIRWFGTIPGLVGGLLHALLWPQVVFPTRVLDATLGSAFVALLAWQLAALDRRPTPWRSTGAGLTVGLLATLRATPLVFVPVELALLAWRGRRDGARRIAVRVALFGLGVVLPIAPVTWRNWSVGGEPVALTSSFGVNFFIGNASGTDGRFMSLGQMALPRGRFDDDPTDGRFERSAAEYAQRESGRPLSAREVSGFWSDLAWKEIGRSPSTAFGRCVRKLWLFADAFETPQVDNVYFLARYAPFDLAWLQVLSRLFWPLAWCGLFLLLFRARELPVTSLLAFVATYAAAIALFFVTDRYRLWITPIAALGAAAAVERLIRAWRGAGLDAVAPTVALGVLGVVCNLNPGAFPPSDVVEPRGTVHGWFKVDEDWYDFARQHNNLSIRCLESGDLERALAEVDAGLALRPDLGALHVNRANALVARARRSAGDPARRDDALHDLDLALVDLRHPAAKGAAADFVRGDLLKVRFDLRADDLALDRELAPILYVRGDFAGAEQAATRWIALAPGDAEAWNTAGGARLKIDRIDDGLAALRTAVQIAPAVPKYSYNLGLGQLKARRFDEAIATLAPLLKSTIASSAVAPYAEALVGAGRNEDARALLVPLLRKQPDHLGALLTLGELELAEGHRATARELAERALAKSPKSERALQLRRAAGE